jgi:hypothetical protein
MSTMWTLLRTTAVAVGSSTALLVSGSGLMSAAHADSEQPLPAPSSADQVTAPATDPNQVLQHIAMALAAQQPAPQPAAGAAIRVPQSAPAAVPGGTTTVAGPTPLIPGTTTTVAGPTPLIPGTTTTVPAATTAVPGLTGGSPGLAPTALAPAAAAPATGATGLMPSAQLDLPQLPFLPVPLPQQMSLPGDLTSLMPGGTPIPRSTIPPSTTVATVPASVPTASPNPLLVPLSALP